MITFSQIKFKIQIQLNLNHFGLASDTAGGEDKFPGQVCNRQCNKTPNFAKLSQSRAHSLESFRPVFWRGVVVKVSHVILSFLQFDLSLSFFVQCVGHKLKEEKTRGHFGGKIWRKTWPWRRFMALAVRGPIADFGSYIFGVG